ncbi:MAG: fructose-1,6-bisphosphatase [Candidatus Entotheonella factor]|uniref:Fructose-1,6-bisphosphatase class 1 n=2 Tax=Candidatus Entotheonella TaxID=93171 RepID=W4LZX0_ENTF1|nr:MAG: fructose-1,6-bisphosphatase [Candidatus Entotheonella factor]
MEQQRDYPEATGDFTGLLTQIALAAKIISREVNKAGLVNILGFTGEKNVQGEAVKKLDIFANEKMIDALTYSGHVCVMGSEEDAEPIALPPEVSRGNYVVMFDPLDGSSNIEAAITIGTIFSIHRRLSSGADGTLEDLLQPGHKQVAAGYVVYGSSTMMVYTTGQGVDGFTLDPSVGEFLLSHPNIRTPERGNTYSANEGNYQYWHPEMQRYMDHIHEKDPASKRPYASRYVGSLVADFHRTLLYGGVFLYPADSKDPKTPTGKLRLLYEASPLAMVIQAAGGKASTGTENILDVQPNKLHQRVPLVIGSRAEVELAEEFFQGNR